MATKVDKREFSKLSDTILSEMDRTAFDRDLFLAAYSIVSGIDTKYTPFLKDNTFTNDLEEISDRLVLSFEFPYGMKHYRISVYLFKNESVRSSISLDEICSGRGIILKDLIDTSTSDYISASRKLNGLLEFLIG